MQRIQFLESSFVLFNPRSHQLCFLLLSVTHHLFYVFEFFIEIVDLLILFFLISLNQSLFHSSHYPLSFRELSFLLLLWTVFVPFIEVHEVKSLLYPIFL
jgi:hypothetical protein